MLKKDIRIYDNLHIVFWLVKDTCWAMQFKTMGLFMIVPTILLSLLFVKKAQKNISELLPSVAITLWIAANSIWMCDEFFSLELKWMCYIPFLAGLCIMTYWLLFYFPVIWKASKIMPEKD